MPENRLYSIGETSKITGVSIQTLRNYSNDGLITPAYIDSQSGYRYFAFHQFHIIDRIKYLRSLDLTLSQIRELISDGSPAAIAEYLSDQAENLKQQILLLKKKKKDLEWYSSYFRYYTETSDNRGPHIRHLKQRMILGTEISSLPVNIEDTEVQLTRLKTEYSRTGASYLRQFGYLLPYRSVLKKNGNRTGILFTLHSSHLNTKRKISQFSRRAIISAALSGCTTWRNLILLP